MAITFTNDRWFRTGTGNKIFQNVLRASQWFKIKVTSRTSITTVSGGPLFISKVIFDIVHRFNGVGTPTTITIRFASTDSAGAACQADVPIPVGAVVGIAFTWDGSTGAQKVWINGVPTSLAPSRTGNTQDNSSALQFGVSDATFKAVFSLDDHNVWDNYLLTPTDISNLLNGADPTTIGVVGGTFTGTWRGRWTMQGTAGNNVAFGDAGLLNAYGGGNNTTGDKSDCISQGGAGTAVYAPPLEWVPTVTATPAYVDTSGRAVVTRFTSAVSGQIVSPSQLLSIPTINVNGGPPVTLPSPWFSGHHSMIWFPLPAGTLIATTDTVTMNAPVAWANTAGGSVASMNNQVLDNRVGKSVIRADNYVPMLPMGLNNPSSPMAVAGFYYPFKNWKYRAVGGFNKYTSPGTYQFYTNTGYNGIDQTNEPGPPGLWLVMWDTAAPSNVNQFGISTNAPTTTLITERTDLKASPPSGIGMCRVFDVQHASLTGTADLNLNLLVSGTVNYNNLWIVGPGDFDISTGAVVLDRSDPYVLSWRYLDRVPQNVGSLRFVDSTMGGDPGYNAFPEDARSLAWESWGGGSSFTTRIPFASIGPVNVTTTPYLYHPGLGRPGAQGTSFTTTLLNPITTTPPFNTKETYMFSIDPASPLMAGLELQIDSEAMRIIAVSGSSVTVNRGSNGTQPAAHTAGTVTVYGRLTIGAMLNASGYFSGAIVWQVTTTGPHGLMGCGVFAMESATNSYPLITFTNGDVKQLFGNGQLTFVTGPTTFFKFAAGTAPGGAPTGVTTLAAGQYYHDKVLPAGAYLPHEAGAIIASKFPNANYHINIWPDACDDMVWRLARIALQYMPPGRKIYVEYNNEPWNSAFGTYTWHAQMAWIVPTPAGGSRYDLMHYAFRSFQVWAIFRQCFAAVGRQDEIVGMLNTHDSNADTVNHLNYALLLGKTVDAVGVAPYIGLEKVLGTAQLVVDFTDEQVISMNVHDLWYNANYPNSWIKNIKDHISSYNASSGNSCFLMGYEGGIEFAIPRVEAANGGIGSTERINGGSGYTSPPTPVFAAPGGTGVTAQGTATIVDGSVTKVTITNPGSGYITDGIWGISFTGGGGTGAFFRARTYIVPWNSERNADCVSHPNWYIFEQDWFAWLQMQGFPNLHIYSLAQYWNPQAWGMYHGIVQDRGRGDGSDGRLNNLLCRAYPYSPQYKGSNVNQDMNIVSVRGQAFNDWLGSLGATPPAVPEKTAWQGKWQRYWYRDKLGTGV